MILEAVVAFARAAEGGIISKPDQLRDTMIAFSAQKYNSAENSNATS